MSSPIVLHVSDHPKKRIQSFLAVHLPGRLVRYLPAARQARGDLHTIPSKLPERNTP